MNWLQSMLPASLWQSSIVLNALTVGTVVAVVTAALGYFVVLRGYSFTGHAVTDIGLAGGSGALLVGLNPLWGLLAFCTLAAGGIDLLGSRMRERDVATGVVLVLMLGVGSLLLYLGTKMANEPPGILLFGSVFEADPAITPFVVGIGLGCLAVLAVLYRPLLFCSASPEAAQVVGVLLSTALLIGPAATASYLSARPGVAIVLAIAIGVVETWLGIVLAYDSYYWGGKSWPVSFFITALALGIYLLARALHPLGRRRAPALSPPASHKTQYVD